MAEDIFAQKGWICPKCGRVNAPWVSTCGCVSSQTSGTPYLVKTSSISRDSHEIAKDEPQRDDLQDWKDRMWAEAVIEPQTESKCPWCGAIISESDNYCSKCGWYLKASDEPQTEICLYCEHYEPKGYCKLKECSVSPNHKCDEYLVIEPYEVKIISKSHERIDGAKAIIEDEPQTYVINPQEPTNDDKCFECDDFFTCDGQCDKVKDEPQTDGYMTAEQARDYHKMLDKAKHKVYGNIEDEPQTDCPWK